MQLNDKIVPGKSLGGIFLNENVDSVFERFSSSYNLKKDAGVLIFDGGLITAGYDSDGLIYSVMCGTKYAHKYDQKLWAGMTVADVIKNTDKQIAYGGCVVVDDINGVGLPLPDGLDDFETITDFLEPGHVFENLSVFRL